VNSYEVVVFYIEEKKVAKDFSHFTAGNEILSVAKCGGEKLLTYLVSHDLDVNYLNASGERVLALAVLYRNIVTINVLLRASANLNLYEWIDTGTRFFITLLSVIGSKTLKIICESC
jgi:hypothetical protein